MKVLVCGSNGTRIPEADKKTFEVSLIGKDLICGCVENSPDIDIHDLAEKLELPVSHHPSTKKEKLRNARELVGMADIIIIYWNGSQFSLRSCFMATEAIMLEKAIRVVTSSIGLKSEASNDV